MIIVQDLFSKHPERFACKPFFFCPTCGNSLVVQELEGKISRTCPDRACGYIDWGNPRNATRVMVRSGNSILLVKTPKGWALPGGIVDSNETTTQTALRELWEETGMTALAMYWLGEYQSTPPGWLNFIVSVFYADVTIDLQQLKVCDLCQEGLAAVRLFHFDALPPDMAYREDRTFIQRLFSGHYDRTIEAHRLTAKSPVAPLTVSP